VFGSELHGNCSEFSSTLNSISTQEIFMPTFETHDGTRLYYKVWGTGKPVIFVSSWALSGEIWEYQTLPLSMQGLRCITYDRRGHGRSDDPGCGYDFNTIADDLAAFIEHLDLREVTLVAHSMGCAEIARYLARHGVSRIARTILVSPSILLNAVDLPQSALKFVEDAVDKLLADRPWYFTHGATKFFGLGLTWPQPHPVSQEMLEWGNHISLQASPRAIIDFWRAMWSTDFRPDMAAFTLPTLIIHGDADQNATLELCGRPLAQAITGSELRIYERAPHGLFLTHKERLNRDILAFVEGHNLCGVGF
jgi:non-heme chloroperoxidase